MAVVDDARVIGVAGERRVHRADRLAQRGDERVEPCARHQHVVGRNARLSGVEELAERDASRGLGQVAIGVDDRRRLSAELERHRCQVLGRGLRDLPADGGRPGEEQVVERQRENARPTSTSAGQHGTIVRREGLGDDPRSSSGKRGVSSLGFSITRLPAAIASATGRSASWNG